MRTTYKNNFAMLVLTATAIYTTVKSPGWIAGWLCGLAAAMIVQRVLDEWEKRTRAKYKDHPNGG